MALDKLVCGTGDTDQVDIVRSDRIRISSDMVF